MTPTRKVETVTIRRPDPSAPRTAEQIRRDLHWALISATCEPDRAVVRCAMNLLRGVEPYEIDPTTGVARTVAGFKLAAATWAERYSWYERAEDADTNPWRHDLVLEGREVQAGYATVHPELAEPVWFPDHGPRDCVFCLMEANEAAGLPVETGMDPVTGGVAIAVKPAGAPA